jgi:hypothetical protein
MRGFDGHTVLIRLKVELVSCDTMELTFLRGAPKGFVIASHGHVILCSQSNNCRLCYNQHSLHLATERCGVRTHEAEVMHIFCLRELEGAPVLAFCSFSHGSMSDLDANITAQGCSTETRNIQASARNISGCFAKVGCCSLKCAVVASCCCRYWPCRFCLIKTGPACLCILCVTQPTGRTHTTASSPSLDASK